MCRSLLALVGWLAWLVPAAAFAVTPVCYPTPAEAAHPTPAAVTATGSGYRAEQRRYDPLLGRYWVVVLDCEHPERPAQTVASSNGPAAVHDAARTLGSTRPAVVKAGSLVRVVSNSASFHLETPAYAESNGAIGDRIRVRLVRLSAEAGQPAVELTATVRGPDYLELE